MKAVVVTYDRALTRDDAAQQERLLASAAKLADLPGLVWKLWLYDDRRHAAASVYLFESEAAARAWADGPMVERLAAYPGVGDVRYELYDVDADLSALTRAPLSHG